MAAEPLFLIWLIPLFLIIFAVFVLLFVLWILMIIDAAKRKFDSEGEKIAWILVIVLVGILGAIIYYFVVKSPADKKHKR